MGVGNIINNTKKIAGLSNGPVFLSQTVKEKIPSNIKTEKVVKEGVEAYSIKEIKAENVEHKKFLSEFVKRMEGDNKVKKY